MKKVLSFLMMLTMVITIQAQGLKIGDTAPDFKLKNIDDKMISLTKDAGDKGAIIIFTCNHCPYSVLYEDRIIAIDKEYKDKGYPVIAINPNDPIQYPSDSFEAMKTRAQEKGFTFPYVFDDKQAIYPLYGATKTPHVYVVERDKKEFKVVYIGAIDNNSKDASAVTEPYLANALNNLLDGKSPDPATTKAIGCGIKAKK